MERDLVKRAMGGDREAFAALAVRLDRPLAHSPVNRRPKKTQSRPPGATWE